VTIVWSDHGSWIGADGGDMRMRFKNLLAIRSDGAPVHLEEDTTTVNVLGETFEQLYGIPFEPRPDTTYRSGPRDFYDLVVEEPGSPADER
jgi:hypothetical protein